MVQRLTVDDVDDHNLAFRTRTVPRDPGVPDNDLPISGMPYAMIKYGEIILHLMGFTPDTSTVPFL